MWGVEVHACLVIVGPQRDQGRVATITNYQMTEQRELNRWKEGEGEANPYWPKPTFTCVKSIAAISGERSLVCSGCIQVQSKKWNPNIKSR